MEKNAHLLRRRNIRLKDQPHVFVILQLLAQNVIDENSKNDEEKKWSKMYFWNKLIYM